MGGKVGVVVPHSMEQLGRHKGARTLVQMNSYERIRTVVLNNVDETDNVN